MTNLTLAFWMESLESEFSIEDLVDKDLIPHNVELIPAPWFIDWVKEYVNDFVKDNDISIIPIGDLRMNHLEDKGHSWSRQWKIIRFGLYRNVPNYLVLQ
jgi:hypothetical protein